MHALNKGTWDFLSNFIFFTPRTCRTNISSLYHFKNERVLRQTNTSARARVKVTGITGFILKFDVKLSPVQKQIDAFNYIANCVVITVEFVYGVFQCNNSRGNEMKLLSVRTFSIVACGSITVQSGCLQIPKLWTKKHSRESLTKFSFGTVLLYNVVSFSLGMQHYKIPLSKRRCNWKVLVDH